MAINIRNLVFSPQQDCKLNHIEYHEVCNCFPSVLAVVDLQLSILIAYYKRVLVIK